MTEFAVTMVKSPGINESERRHRLAAVYRLILNLPSPQETAEREELADPNRSAAGDTDPERTDAVGE